VTRLLVLLCGLLLAVTWIEVTHRPGVASATTQANATARRPAPQPVKPTAQSGGARNHWMTVALARPLFAPDRKPIAGAVAADPGMPRLTGIIASPDAAVAIFQPAGDARPMVTRHGDTIDGWQVTDIATEGVNLRKDNQVIVLSPRFAGAPHPGAAVQEAKKSASRWEAPAATGMLRARWSNPQLQP
jgi:general secretion pathway protein N